jgi:hypothetical protein
VPVSDLLPGDYADFARPILEAFAAPALTTRESDVAQAVWAAVQDRAGRLRFPAGPMRWRWRRRVSMIWAPWLPSPRRTCLVPVIRAYGAS